MDSFAVDGSTVSDDAADTASTAATWQSISTLEIPKQERFDFCRALPVGSHIERPLGDRGDFDAEFRYAGAPGGIGFVEMDIDPCVSRFGPGDDDTLVNVGMLHAGTMHIRYGRDQTLVLNAEAGPALFDAARPMITCNSRSELTYLRLPRAAVVAAVGGDAVPAGQCGAPVAARRAHVGTGCLPA